MSETTIVIPVYDPTNSEKDRFQRLVDSIVLQTLAPGKVIFAGNQKPDYFKSLVLKLENITAIDFQVNSTNGAAANLNQLLRKVTTDLTKIMFQDDFFTCEESLSVIMTDLEKANKSWIVSGCTHHYEEDPKRVRTITPKFTRRLVKGRNTIGAPSVVAVKTEFLLPFNEQMVYMFDCEWYLRMTHKHGKPAIIKRPLISIGIHGNQATHWAKESLTTEKIMCRQLHKVSIFTGDCASCKNMKVRHD